MTHGSERAPNAAVELTPARYEKTRSLACASPLVPSSTSIWLKSPPIDERLQLTKTPVLTGADPGVTVTVSSVARPGATVAGDVLPTAVGLDAEALAANTAKPAAAAIRPALSLTGRLLGRMG